MKTRTIGRLLAGVIALSFLAARGEVMVESKHGAKSKWESNPTRTIEDLKDFAPKEIPLTKFGGRADRREKATGSFRVQKVGDRWWLVDPEGGLFIDVGVATVTTRAKYGSKEAFEQKFGSMGKWAEGTLQMMREAGFNGTGGWSDVENLRAAKQPIAYTVSLNLLSSFGKKFHLTYQQPGHSGYAHDCLPVFHPDFPAFCDAMCREKIAASKDDAWLVGYFSDNELPAPMKMLDNMLALDATNKAFASLREAAQKWMGGRKHEKITDEDRTAFLGFVYETYLRVTTAAIRKADPNHLCLGPRFHNPVRERREVWEAAGKYLDAIAMNYYGTWTPRSSDLDNWAKWSGRPCMITEFYTKGSDTPLANSTGAGWIVKTQKDRGLFYQNYVLALLESKSCVGWHWFKYMDNDPEDTSVDPSNRDSNKGIVTIRYEPYAALIEKMKPVNQNVYSITDWMDRGK